jgi:murein DD-endopeptidase MepM/ murein hydrolase activator NlpD
MRFVPAVIVAAALAGCGDGPDVLGDELAVIASRAGYVIHVVKAGETLWSISRHYGATVSDLTRLNGINSSAELEVGQEMRVPIGPAEYSGIPEIAAGSWTRPVRGEVVVGFGELKDGLKSWGIDVRTAPGAAVVAAGDGLVRLSGPFVGLGSTVAIEHEGGKIVTIYGRIGSLLVGKGDVVSKGQRIGTAPGFLDEPPVIHVRMYSKGRPVDPERYLP